MKADLEILPKL